jgi:peptidyl-dipeptidase A
LVCKELGELSQIIAESSDPQQLLEAWAGWRTISPPMKQQYARMVVLANEGARELGYKDLGAMWRSKYDMPADDFSKEMDRLWGEVKPLYQSLHCYVRGKLNAKYGDEIVADTGTIPAHLLGNMWAQSWENLYPIVKPETEVEGIDLTTILNTKGYPNFAGLNKKGRLETAKKMVKTAENFFISLGFKALPETFWERSLFIKPEDRSVVCHASAWDIDQQDDLRIKMCIKSDAEDFATIHHELGHNFYQRAYKDQSPLFRNSANDGFHEAAGDLISLSITPSYLKKIHLIDEIPQGQDPVPQLMRKALEKVAFLPFGLMVDKWRWQVFSGEVDEQHYNQAWWKLRQEYQGIHAPIARAADDFDPGAKYHIPGNTPYARYFLAHILQFQWHRDLCRASGFKGALHECSIYDDKQAGEKIKQMFSMGLSKPWPQALAVISGTEKMDATAVTEYFAPLQQYLDQQNKGKTCGW